MTVNGDIWYVDVFNLFVWFWVGVNAKASPSEFLPPTSATLPSGCANATILMIEIMNVRGAPARVFN